MNNYQNKINRMDKYTLYQQLDDFDTDVVEIKNDEGIVTKIKFDICDTGLVIFNVEKWEYDFIKIFKGKKLDYRISHLIDEYIGLYFNSFMDEWYKESNKYWNEKIKETV